MSKIEAVRAYRDSLIEAARIDMERRAEERSIPILGGIWPSLKLLGNGLSRPFLVTGALLLGGDRPENRDFPTMPAVPETLKNSSLGSAFNDSWKLKEEAAKARVEGFAKLLDLDISSWWQKNSVASYAETRDTHVVFPEDGIARERAATISFVDSIGRGSDSGMGR